MKFTISLRGDEAVSPYALGDVLIESKWGVIDSAGRKPDQGMMIFVSLSDLMLGVCRLYRGEVKKYEFVGVDSSFAFLISRRSEGIYISNKNVKIVCSELDFLDALRFGVNAFLDKYLCVLPQGSVSSDLYYARSCFDKIRRSE